MKNRLLKFSLFISSCLIFANVSNAQPYYPDVCSYEIHLDEINHTTKNIVAITNVTFTVHQPNVNQIDLSLELFIIDSIIQNGQQLTYAYNDTLLQINLNTPMNAGDTSTISIAYHGITHTEASGWGGFHVDANYAFNMGVGFETDRIIMDDAGFHVLKHLMIKHYMSFCNYQHRKASIL